MTDQEFESCKKAVNNLMARVLEQCFIKQGDDRLQAFATLIRHLGQLEGHMIHEAIDSTPAEFLRQTWHCESMSIMDTLIPELPADSITNAWHSPDAVKAAAALIKDLKAQLGAQK